MSRWLRAKTLIVLVAVLAVFLLHAVSGPFSVTHGPATALRAMQKARLLQQGLMLRCAGVVLPISQTFSAFFFFCAAILNPALKLPECCAILRC